MFYAILLMITAGAILGFILGFAADKLVVVEDPLLTTVTEMLPGYNCGGCGYPGCAGFANALLNGEVNTISKCRPSKPEAREQIKEIFDTTPNLDGEMIKVNL